MELFCKTWLLLPWRSGELEERLTLVHMSHPPAEGLLQLVPVPEKTTATVSIELAVACSSIVSSSMMIISLYAILRSDLGADVCRVQRAQALRRAGWFLALVHPK